MLEDAFALYDEVAMGAAVGITASLVLAVATALLLLGPAREFVPMLSLLGQYLFGYQLSWPGLVIGMVEVALAGFGLGWLTARMINLMVAAWWLVGWRRGTRPRSP